MSLVWPANHSFMKAIFLVNKYSPLLDFTFVVLGTSELAGRLRGDI